MHRDSGMAGRLAGGDPLDPSFKITNGEAKRNEARRAAAGSAQALLASAWFIWLWYGMLREMPW